MIKIEEGDWVRYYNNGRLTIGVVQYVRPKRSDFWEPEICTDVGTAYLSEVIEVRSARGIETTIDPTYMARLVEARAKP